MTCGRPCTIAGDSCIRRVPIFEALNEQEMIGLQKKIRSSHYEKGEFIFREGEASDLLFVLREGVVKISKYSGTGKEQLIRLKYPGDFFGKLPLLHDKKQYANAEVLERASVCFIQRSDLLSLLEKNPATTYRFLLAVSELLQQTDERMSMISLLEVEKRLAKTLLLYSQKEKTADNVILKLPVAKKELASMLGTTPETISRKLADLETKQMIATDRRGRIRLLDLNRLTELAEA